MRTMQKREVSNVDLPDMTLAELENEWLDAKECFEQALARKTETDRVYAAAAGRLNALERLVKKVEYRAVVARREAAKLLSR